jgi:hypothetical protein
LLLLVFLSSLLFLELRLSPGVRSHCAGVVEPAVGELDSEG